MQKEINFIENAHVPHKISLVLLIEYKIPKSDLKTALKSIGRFGFETCLKLYYFSNKMEICELEQSCFT